MFLEGEEQRVARKLQFNMLPRSLRIGTSLFSEITEKGRFSNGKFFLFRFVKSEGKSRFSVTVSKKVSKSAVDRNKIRRRVYSLLRKHISNIKDGYRIVISVKSGTDKIDIKDLNKELESDFVKSGLLK